MAPKKSEAIHIEPVGFAATEFYLIGVTPLVLHAMSAKAKQELLLPKGSSAAKKSGTPYELGVALQAWATAVGYTPAA